MLRLSFKTNSTVKRTGTNSAEKRDNAEKKVGEEIERQISGNTGEYFLSLCKNSRRGGVRAIKLENLSCPSPHSYESEILISLQNKKKERSIEKDHKQF